MRAERVVVEYDPLPAGTPLFDAPAGRARRDVHRRVTTPTGCSTIVRSSSTSGSSHPRTGRVPDGEPRCRVGVGLRRAAAPLAERAGAARGEDGAAGGLRPRCHAGPRRRARRRRRVRAEVRQLPRGRRDRVGGTPTRPSCALVRDAQREHGRLHHGRAQVQTVTLGGHARRRLLAYHLEIEQDAGAYASLGVYVPEATLRMTTGVYAIPRARATATVRLSATTPVSAYRGSGRPEATGAIERAIDVFAREIGMDPVDAAPPQPGHPRRSRSRPRSAPCTTPAITNGRSTCC